MATKTSVCKKFYVTKDGGDVKSPSSADHDAADIDRLEFRFASGTTRVVKMADFKERDILAAATWHGFAQKLGDAYSGQKKAETDPVELFDAVYENLVDGLWIEKGEGAEAAPGLLVDAIVAAMTAEGLSPDPAKVKEKLTPRNDDGTVNKPAAQEARKGALANPAVKKAYEQAKLDRQKARLDAASKEAKAAGKDAAAGLGAFM